MPEAARLKDPIAHSHALGGLIVGAMIGAAIAVAVVGTGGLAAVAIVAGAAVGGAAVGELVGSLSMSMSVKGMIAEQCSPNVKINGRPAARAHVDVVDCEDHSSPRPVIAQGSGSVNTNGLPAPRKGDRIACDAVIYDGSANVFIGGPTVSTDEISPEVPGWVHGAMLVVGVASAAILAGPVVAAVGLLGGMLGGEVGGALGGKLFGEGSDGQKLMAFGGGVLGGLAGGKGGAWFDRNYEIKSVGLGSNLGNMWVVPKAAPNTAVEASVSRSAHPESAQHVLDAQANGHPVELTIDRAGAKANRAESLSGIDKVPGKQLDEYPPAMFKEGGAGASVRPISPSDNMGSGASLGNQLRKIPDGSKVKIIVKD